MLSVIKFYISCPLRGTQLLPFSLFFYHQYISATVLSKLCINFNLCVISNTMKGLLKVKWIHYQAFFSRFHYKITEFSRRNRIFKVWQKLVQSKSLAFEPTGKNKFCTPSLLILARYLLILRVRNDSTFFFRWIVFNCNHSSIKYHILVK